MRISDWSSDVCSSDLIRSVWQRERLAEHRLGHAGLEPPGNRYDEHRTAHHEGERRVPVAEHIEEAAYPLWFGHSRHRQAHAEQTAELGRASCRERGCQYVEISVVAVH